MTGFLKESVTVLKIGKSWTDKNGMKVLKE